MRGVNKVILIGNATRDAELRHTSTGKPVSSIRLATNRSVKGEEETQFHSVVCWDRLAETTAEYVKKAIRSTSRAGYSTAPIRTKKAKNAGWPRSSLTTCSSSAVDQLEAGVTPRRSPPLPHADTRIRTASSQLSQSAPCLRSCSGVGDE